MTLSGNINELGRIGATVNSLGDVPRIAESLAAEKIEALVSLEFDVGVDPYGEPWQPLAPATIASGRFAPPLTDTRELRESLLVYPSREAGVRVTIGTASHPAGPHQDGWSGRQGSGPARPILPTPERGLPLSWESAIQDSAIEAVTEKLKEVAA